MSSAEKIVIADADKILKNIGPVDAEVIRAYIEIKTNNNVRNKLVFDKVLTGIFVVLALGSLCLLLSLMIMGINQSVTFGEYNRRITEAETNIEHISDSLQKDQDELVRKVKTMCDDFEKEYQQ